MMIFKSCSFPYVFSIAAVVSLVGSLNAQYVNAEDNKPDASDTSKDLPMFEASPIPKHYDIQPSKEVLDAVSRAMGGVDAEKAAQTKNALKGYKQAEQTMPEVHSLRDTVTYKLGQASPLLYVSQGFEGEILFFDSNGRPWEVGKVSTGNKKFLNAVKGEVLPHSVTIGVSENQYAGKTNLKVAFKGLETSVSFQVHINTIQYHETFKVVLPGTNPDGRSNNQAGGYSERYAMDDPVARSILDNPIKPESAESCENRLAITKSITGQTLLGIQPVIFACDSGLYIRARYLSSPNPDPNGVVRGPNGFSVYRFLDAGDYFTFFDRSGQPVFVEAVKPGKIIGARFGEQVRLN